MSWHKRWDGWTAVNGSAWGLERFRVAWSVVVAPQRKGAKRVHETPPGEQTSHTPAHHTRAQHQQHEPRQQRPTICVAALRNHGQRNTQKTFKSSNNRYLAASNAKKTNTRATSNTRPRPPLPPYLPRRLKISPLPLHADSQTARAFIPTVPSLPKRCHS